MLKKIIGFVSVLVLVGCGTTTSTTTVRTPNGERTVKVNEGPYSKDRSEEIDSTAAHRDCVRMHAPQMGTSGADAYCRNQTSGGPVAGPQGALVGPGMMMVPGALNGMPGAMPIPMPSPGQVALERSPGMAVAVVTPGGPGLGSPGTTNGDAALIVREQANQHKRLCELEAKQGRPCKK